MVNDFSSQTKVNMQIITSLDELRNLCYQWRFSGVKTGLVPTMGYFHEGHMSLMQYARANSDKLITTLFVNPAQFGENEDLDTYPRDLERDAAIAKAQGTDILFAPEAGAMYVEDHMTWVEVPHMAKRLCGISRPVFFRGICTVVTKLFMLTLPSMAVFGEKDWQQLAIIRRMVNDLNIPTEIHGCPIVREADGLALSSRNVYLSPEERSKAPHINKGLQVGCRRVKEGEKEVAAVKQAVRDYWQENVPDAKEDYLEIFHPHTLEYLEKIDGEAHVACALQYGRTRLIDNCSLA